MKYQMYASLLFVVLTGLSCQCNKNQDRFRTIIDCISDNYDSPNSYLLKLDSLISKDAEKFDSIERVDFHWTVYLQIMEKELSINLRQIWRDESDPVEFFSPANLAKIKICLEENKNQLKEKDLEKYLYILQLPFEHLNRIVVDKYVRELVRDNFENELDRFFYLYLLWYVSSINL